MKPEARGFTLVELMIVVGIIAILTVIAVPKYADAIEKANLGATLGNLAAIRSAVTIYYSTYMKIPGRLDVSQPAFGDIMGIRLPPVKSHYPLDHPPAGYEVEYGMSVPGTQGRGWYYSTVNGGVWVNSTAADVKGINYTVY